jgi:hypothetical protein
MTAAARGSEVLVKMALLLSLLAAALAAALAVGGVLTPAFRSLPPPGPLAGGCAAAPHRCGFPDATNTGVPAGMTLKSVPAQVSRGPGWYYDSRGFVEVDGNGAVLRGLYIPHNLDISASDVIISDDRIVNSGQSSFGVSLRHTRNVTIEDSDICGPNGGSGRLMVGVKDVYGDSSGTSVLRNNIWHASTGVQMGEGVIEGNYLHSPGFLSGDHINGITSNGGRTLSMTIQHNTVFVNYPQNDAVSLFEDFGIQGNRTINDNLLAGGGYTIYGGRGKQGQPFNIRITNNRISSIYFPSGGHWGPVAYYSPEGPGNVWSGNVWDETGRPIGIPAGAGSGGSPAPGGAALPGITRHIPAQGVETACSDCS